MQRPVSLQESRGLGKLVGKLYFISIYTNISAHCLNTKILSFISSCTSMLKSPRMMTETIVKQGTSSNELVGEFKYIHGIQEQVCKS